MAVCNDFCDVETVKTSVWAIMLRCSPGSLHWTQKTSNKNMASVSPYMGNLKLSGATFSFGSVVGNGKPWQSNILHMAGRHNKHGTWNRLAGSHGRFRTQTFLLAVFRRQCKTTLIIQTMQWIHHYICNVRANNVNNDMNKRLSYV